MGSRSPWPIDIYGRLEKLESDFQEVRSDVKALGDKTEALGEKTDKAMKMMKDMFFITTVISIYAAVKRFG